MKGKDKLKVTLIANTDLDRTSRLAILWTESGSDTVSMLRDTMIEALGLNPDDKKDCQAVRHSIHILTAVWQLWYRDDKTGHYKKNYWPGERSKGRQEVDAEEFGV